MAGTLTISTLSDGTNSTSSTNCIQGSAKALVYFNGGVGPTINGSFNVSSVTRNGTGDYTVNFTTAMANSNYAAFCNSGFVASASCTINVIPYASGNTTSSIRFASYTNAIVAYDAPYYTVSVFSS